MSSSPKSRATQIGIAAACLIFLGLYLYTVLAVWRADWLQDQGTRQSLEASARIVPWDARTHWLLGSYFLNVSQDQTRALANFDRAVQLDPFEGRYWLDVAAATELAGDARGSETALERALRAEPTSPSIAWESANFYLAQNNMARSLPLFRVAMQYGTRSMEQAAIDLCWRATQSVSQMASLALPPQTDAYFTFLRILITRGESEPANEVWRALIALKLKFSNEQVFPYFDYLIKTKQVDQAEEVWRFLGQADSELPGDRRLNLLSDGGFEGKYLNGGFGWRAEQYSQVDVSLDTSQFHSGTRALRFVFSGPAFSDSGVSQYVPVEPNVRYRLSSFVKSEDIVSASGPRIVVQDYYNNQVLASTEDLLSTSGWRELLADFATGPETRLIAIKVMRVPGNPLIKGTFWLDDVKLSPMAKPANGSQPF